jgi:hypothetical protein
MGSTIKTDEIEQAKAQGNYRLAGQLTSLANLPCYYGCHYGMRNDRQYAIEEFIRGWKDEEAKRQSTKA